MFTVAVTRPGIMHVVRQVNQFVLKAEDQRIEKLVRSWLLRTPTWCSLFI